ncbi:MAG: response regulator transcription factor [Cyanobacteria bacterium]|nr:response regulator transcription factor [Cyanobacteriota bacterium]
MATSTHIRILGIDDHPLLREGIATMIALQPDMTLVGQAATGQEGISQFRALKPDITLMDVRLPDMTGIDALIALRSEFVNARVVMLSTFQGDVEAQRAMAAGARGFLLKTMPPEEIVSSLRQVHAGKRCLPPEVAMQLADYISEDALTTREIEIVRLLGGGHSNRDVADMLAISESTVKVHVRHVMEKLGAHDRTEAVVIALRRGIISL